MSQIERTVTAMQQLGGSFIRCIALSWQVADEQNRARLERAFAPEFRQYEALSLQADPEMQP